MRNPQYVDLGPPHLNMHSGDCIDILPQLDRNFPLIFADPPFNYQQDYDVCEDSWDSMEEYEDWTDRWLTAAASRLTYAGSMWINVPDEIVAFVDRFCTNILGLTRVNWCQWHYRFGQCTRGRFIRSKVHALWYTNDDNKCTWNPNAILVPSDRASKYGDSRTEDSKTPGVRVPLDVWGIPSDGSYWGRVQGNNKERCPNHPNQLPEKYLERVIRACSNEGDWILDPFAGSNTTGTVARALDRNFAGIELSPTYAESGFKRALKGAVRVGEQT